MDRAVHAAAARFLCPSSDVLKLAASDAPHATSSLCMMERPLVERKHLMIETRQELGTLEFNKALRNYVPAAMQGIDVQTVQDGRSGWEDVGGLTETRQALQEVSFSPCEMSIECLH